MFYYINTFKGFSYSKLMEIRTEQDMIEFCNITNPYAPFDIHLMVHPSSNLKEMKKINQEMIRQKVIGEGSHLQQGIDGVSYISRVLLCEIPYIYPSGRLLAEHPELTGPMTGTLSNCYDPQSQRFLFHMRGTNISAPFGFQAAAAGMGVYGQHPSVTAALELCQEAGLEHFEQFPRDGLAINCLPFMKAGKIPQPLFSFGFLDDLSRFPVCNSLDDIAGFEARIKKGLQDRTLEQKEAYHFTLPKFKVETIVGELNDGKRFYGPIYESTMNFMRALKDEGIL